MPEFTVALREVVVSSQNHANDFILQAFDPVLWCPVAQAIVHVPDIEVLRSILGGVVETHGDGNLEYEYWLNDDELAAIVAAFDIDIEPRVIRDVDRIVSIFRRSPLFEVPYLVHTGYELPLLLDGRKKLAWIDHRYPPEQFEGEDRFRHWVKEGVLHQEETIFNFDTAHGYRTVYYTPKGEEWRIPAMKMVKTCRWNEHFERLEGMLFGYEDWQNDWWINFIQERGGFGATYFCVVEQTDLDWIEASGFRALPPKQPSLRISRYDADREHDWQGVLAGHNDCAAIVRFTVPGYPVSHIIDHHHGGPWDVPSHQVRELNKHMVGAVKVMARRHT
jgi:hypothetical protein